MNNLLKSPVSFLVGIACFAPVVEKLNDRTGGKVGITGGDAGEGGYFANLKITPKKP
jgi:hypothetical protein